MASFSRINGAYIQHQGFQYCFVLFFHIWPGAVNCVTIITCAAKWRFLLNTIAEFIAFVKSIIYEQKETTHALSLSRIRLLAFVSGQINARFSSLVSKRFEITPFVASNESIFNLFFDSFWGEISIKVIQRIYLKFQARPESRWLLLLYQN